MKNIAVDTHVHLHPGMDAATCLDAAAGQMPGAGGDLQGVLMLTEMTGQDAFGALTDGGGWTIRPTDEPMSKLATGPDGTRLAVIAGRQIVTGEGLEVLALGLMDDPGDGQPLGRVIDAVVAAGALAVLPWGVGKWTGRRGALIDALIAERAGAHDLFLADSGVRPAFAPRPARLARAEEAGWRVLAGTDPLPLPGEEAKPGRYGVLLDVDPGSDRPFERIAAALRALTVSPPTYGRLESGPRFLHRQVAMQRRKRFG
ncbi:hypothetical protein [Marinibacterium sp. SX1]|uniref:hypothetical protein n=1 Tax=Marinibacterium sp. SX1 TaxID=3388424 RepID=UPI003D17DCCE